MVRDASVWLAAALLAYAVAVNAVWWAGERAPASRGRRIDAFLAVSRWLYLGVLPLAALGMGVMPLWLAGWTMPSSWPVAVTGALLAAGIGAAILRVAADVPPAERSYGRSGEGRRRSSFERLGACCADVVLREAHWGFVRAGVVAAAPGWFAVPGGAYVGLGQALVLGLLFAEIWVHPYARHAAMAPDGARAASAIGVAAAASHLGWMLAGTAGAGLAAHVVVALVALRYPPAGTTAPPADALDRPMAVIEPTIVG